MTFRGKRLDELEVPDLHDLIGNVREGRTIDFKENLPGGTKADRKEFLADVSSFANGAGGHLVFGISEREGVASDFSWLEGNLDSAISRLESMIRDGVEPRLPSHEIELVESPDGVVLIVEIPRSWAGPHAVRAGTAYRFYSRNANGKYALDIPEVRAAFAVATTLQERLTDFRADRVAAIDAGQTPVRLAEGVRLVLHIIPFGSFETGSAFDLSDTYLPPVEPGSFSHRHTFEGVLTWYPTPEGATDTYSMGFRSGSVEAVAVFSRDQERTDLPTRIIERTLVEWTRAYSGWQRDLGVSPPLAIAVSLVDVEGCWLGMTEGIPRTAAPIDRPVLLIPPVVMEAFDEDIPSLLRAPIDTIWNAGGWPGSQNYGPAGQWRS